MQIFLFGALAISLAAVLFALQNNIPVTVSFFGWTFSGSLAVILFLAVAAGALASSLASLPALVKARWASSQHRKQVATLEANLADAQRRVRDAEARVAAPSQPDMRVDLPGKS